MKRSLRFASRLLARLRQSLHLLKEALGQRVAPQAPVLVPIPIQSERRQHRSGHQRRARGD